MRVTSNIPKTFSQTDYTWLDPQLPFFGAKNGGVWLFQEKGDACLNYVFELHDPRFPGGYAIGKCNLYSQREDLLDSPDRYEAQCLTFLSQEANTLACASSLPDIYAVHTLVPVFCNGLRHLPMRSSSAIAHPYCDVIIARAYWGTMRDLTENLKQSIPAHIWKYIIFDVTHALYVLQEATGFQHHDLHDKNILINTLPHEVTRQFTIDDHTFRFDGLRLSVVLWDFETAVFFKEQTKSRKRRGRHDISIPSLKVPPMLQQNDNRGPADSKPMRLLRFYDLHQFLMHVLETDHLPDEIADFIRGLYPPELIPDFDEVAQQVKNMQEETDDEDDVDEVEQVEMTPIESWRDHAHETFWYGLKLATQNLCTLEELKEQDHEHDDEFWNGVYHMVNSVADRGRFVSDVRHLYHLLQNVHDSLPTAVSTKILRENLSTFLKLTDENKDVEHADDRDVEQVMKDILSNTCTFFTPKEVIHPLRQLLTDLTAHYNEESDDTEMQDNKGDEIREDEVVATDDNEEESDEDINAEEDENVAFARFYKPNANFQQYVVSQSKMDEIENDLNDLKYTYAFYPPNKRNTLTYVKLLETTWDKYGSRLITPKQLLLHPFFTEFRE